MIHHFSFLLKLKKKLISYKHGFSLCQFFRILNDDRNNDKPQNKILNISCINQGKQVVIIILFHAWWSLSIAVNNEENDHKIFFFFFFLVDHAIWNYEIEKISSFSWKIKTHQFSFQFLKHLHQLSTKYCIY